MIDCNFFSSFDLFRSYYPTSTGITDSIRIRFAWMVKVSHFHTKTLVSKSMGWINANNLHIFLDAFLVQLLWIQLNEYRDRSIFSVSKPSFDILLFQDLWRFKYLFLQVANLKLFRIQKQKFFEIICILQITAILCKSSEILKQYGDLWWLIDRNYRAVSWTLSCTKLCIKKINI